ncbi:unnamed protein product [Rotaria sp. Silwood2]|nr:unnamed protein product [Rotaria sp. Silwood2]CAF3194285.1 unnamed protein product [Rotaria sp. Silwood2]CAF3488236.1 unnamed protein product [Rotaria sp. Silwood2]CAF4579422.1 unnamed protein product [Rotaria sp. Silwood2]CAF4591851.1 unnamed protein product [Rotaria sp. Silwood2]
MHNSCYMRFFDLKKNNKNDGKQNQEGSPTIKVDVGVQTEPSNNHLSSTSPSGIFMSTKTSSTGTSDTTTDSASIEQLSDSTMKLPFYRLDKFTKKCCICNADFHPKRRRSIKIDTSIRIQCLIEHHIFIENESKCYSAHVSNGLLKIDAINKIKQNYSNHCTVYRDELINMFNEMKQELKNKDSTINKLKNTPLLDFNDNETFMSDKHYHILTRLTRNEFNDLCSYIPSTALRTTDVRTPRMAIACLLVKLRLGVSHDTLCTLFGIDDKRRMNRILESANSALTQYFVPKHLGFHHITREQVLKQHTRPLAQQLLANDNPNKAIIILDGTYVYARKSANNLLQRRTYSVHKGKPLVKPMMIVSTDGYIISVIGPYFADSKNNDAEITKSIIYNNKEDMLDWLAPGDVIVVDR